MMQNPLDLTQGDLQGLMEAGQTLANIPGVGGGSSPLGGIGELLNTGERFLNLWGKLNEHFVTSTAMVVKLRSAEGLGIDPPAQGSFFPSGQIIEGGVYQPPERTVTTPSEPEPEPLPEPGPTPTVEPIKLYSTMLGYLSKLADKDSPFKDLTLKDALELARANKTLVLGAIEEELPKLLGSDDGPRE
jgi:hypothetical protein